MKRKEKWQLENFVLSFREIWRFDKRLIFILFVNVLVSAAMPFPNVLFSGQIVDSILSGNNFSVVFFYIILLFGFDFCLSAISIGLNKAREYLFIKLTNKLDCEINKKCMDIDYERFNDSAIQDRILLINQAVRGNNFFTSLTIVFDTISQGITLFGIIIIMTRLSFWLLWVSVMIVILQAMLHYIRLKYIRENRADAIHEQRNIGYTSQLAKDIEIKKDLTTYDMSGYLTDKINFFQKSVLFFERKRIKNDGIVETLIYFLSIVFQISAYCLLGYNAMMGEISIGDFTVGVATLIHFMSASTFIATNVVSFNDGFFYITQYNAFMNSGSKYNEKKTVTMDDFDLTNPEFEFKNVSFRYPNSTSYVLRNINIKIKAKEKLAVVGLNGAGKTTFVLLLTRMYDPTEGDIYLNGVNIKDIDYREYQKLFATVNQDYSLLAFSLLSNIAINDNPSESDRTKIEELICQNGLDERMSKLYRGMETPITKTLSASGIDLSGGERQKVAIIRALFKDAPVLILDEPTSALDPIAEQEIYQKFADMTNGKLTVFISHRIYSTRFCDKIVVFDKGEIKECDAFEELLKKRGLYYKLYQKQAEYFYETDSI